MAEIQPASRDGLVVCVCDGREYTARDAVDAALIRGELDSSWKEFLCKLDAETRATEQDLELDQDAINEMAELFRYEHDLITAEETEQWLEQRGLTLEDFSDYFERRFWRTTVGEVSPQNVDFLSASGELRELFTIELIFDGELDLLIKELTWRLAAAATTSKDDVDSKEIALERKRFLDRTTIKASQLDGWLVGIGRDGEWLKQVLEAEAAYHRTCAAVLNPETRKKQLLLLRMPLTHFEAEAIEVESRDAAREALLCIREDGMSMEQLAAEARYPYRQVTFRHEDVPAELQQKFWSAGAGDLLEPLPRGDGFELYRIIQKREPDLGDSIVQQRIDDRLLEQHFSQLVRGHVESRLHAANP